jgi:TRAP-type C4-dicarboxylate transport system permease small subunit
MSPIDRAQQTNVGLTRIVALLAVGLILAGSAITVADVVLRSSIRKPIFGANDIVLLILVVAVTACFPHALAMREHMRIAAFGKAVGGRVGHWLCEIFSGVVVMLVFAGFTWQFARRAMTLTATREETPLLAWHIGPWWWAATALLALATLSQLIVVLVDVQALATGKECTAREELSVQ